MECLPSVMPLLSKALSLTLSWSFNFGRLGSRGVSLHMGSEHRLMYRSSMTCCHEFGCIMRTCTAVDSEHARSVLARPEKVGPA